MEPGPIELEMFRPDLEAAVPPAGRSKGDRSPFDHALMFEVLILRAMRSLSGEHAEYLIRGGCRSCAFSGSA